MTPINFINSYKSKIYKSIALDGVSRLFILFFLFSFCVCVLDFFFHLPIFIRVSLLILLLAFLLRVMIKYIKAIFTKIHKTDIAKIIESKFPFLEGALFNAINDISINDADKGKIEKISSTNVPLSEKNNVKKRVLIAFAYLLLAAFFTYTAFDQNTRTKIAIQRFIMPWKMDLYPKSNKIEWKDKPVYTVANEVCFLKIDRTLGTVKKINIEIKNKNGYYSNETYSIQNNSCLINKKLPKGNYTIKASANDANPIFFDIKSIKRPSIEKINSKITPPKYTRLKSTELKSLNILGMRGSQIDFEFTVNKDHNATSEKCFFYIDDKLIKTKKLKEKYYGTFSLQNSQKKVKVTATDSYGISSSKMEFPIQIIKDKPPVFQITGINNNETITEKAVLEIKIKAIDDIGIKEIALHNSNEKEKGWNKINTWQIKNKKQKIQKANINIKELNIKSGSFYLKTSVSDHDPNKKPSSKAILVKIISEVELRQELEQRIAIVKNLVEKTRDLLINKEPSKAISNTAVIEQKLKNIHRRYRINNFIKKDYINITKGIAILSPIKENLQNKKAIDLYYDLYKLLDEMLSSEDLLKDLCIIIEKQKKLSESSKTAYMKCLTSVMNKQLKQELQILHDRQKNISVKELNFEQNVFKKIKNKIVLNIIRTEKPSEKMSETSTLLKNNDSIKTAIEQQSKIEASLQKLYKELRGNTENTKENKFTKEIKNILEEQAILMNEIQNKTKATNIKSKINTFSKKWEKDLSKTKMTPFVKLAEKEMDKAINESKKNTDSASQHLKSSMEYLKRLLKNDKQKNESSQGKDIDLIKELIKMYKKQQDVIVLSLDIPLPPKQLNFKNKRTLLTIAKQEDEIRSFLAKVILPNTKKQMIVTYYIKEINKKLKQASKLFNKTIYNKEGEVLLQKILNALGELIELSKEKDEQNTDTVSLHPKTNSNNGGGGQSSQPPFPELKILLKEQEKIALRVFAKFEITKLAEEQDRLLELLTDIEGKIEKGRRIANLLNRLILSMERNVDYLTSQKFNTRTNLEQRLSVNIIKQMINELIGSVNLSKKQKQQKRDASNDNSNAQTNKEKTPDSTNNKQTSDNKNNNGSNNGNSNNSSNTANNNGEAKESDRIMRLNERKRKQINESMKVLPEEGVELFESYLQVLEELDIEKGEK